MGYINEIKTKDGQKYDVQDKRIIEVTPADVGKVLTVESDGSLAFKTLAGGTKLYWHQIIYDTFHQVNIYSHSSEPLTYNTIGSLVVMLKADDSQGNICIRKDYQSKDFYFAIINNDSLQYKKVTITSDMQDIVTEL